MPGIVPNIIATSVTLRAIGPVLSWLCEMGMTPPLLINPIVGLKPTRQLFEDGPTIDPSVSEPMVAIARFAAAAEPDPELEPPGTRSKAYGFRQKPPFPPFQPLPLHPDVPRYNDFPPAHSLMFAFPSRTAPANRSFLATKESCSGIEPFNAVDPAVVVIRSAVSTLSFKRIGTQWRGPLIP